MRGQRDLKYFAGFLLVSMIPALHVYAESPTSPSAAVKPSSSSAETTASQAKKEADAQPYRLFPEMKWGAEEEFKLKITGDTRFRAEYQNNFDMDRKKRDENAYPQYLRSRLRFDLTYKEMTRVFLELADSREWNRDVGEPNQKDPVDVQQAYIELKQPNKGPWTVRLGRQELIYGKDRRLVNAAGWSNLRRRHTGIRADYKNDKTNASFFLVQPEFYERRHNGRVTTGKGRPLGDMWFYGLYLNHKYKTDHSFDFYVLAQSDTDKNRKFPYENISENKKRGSYDRYTVGNAWYGKLGKTETGEFDYTTEGAYQFGRFSEDDIRAFFLRGDLTYSWSKPAWKPTLGILGTWASGDQNPNDGIAGRFNNVYGDNHAAYGIMDFANVRNLRELGVIATVKPTKKLELQLEGHQYWADSKRDVVLNPPSGGNVRDASGRSGRGAGQEVSLVGIYKLSENVKIEGGAAHFFPGEVPRNNGKSDGANLFYIQTQIDF